jgi:fatty-acyl-CoA synthase
MKCKVIGVPDARWGERPMAFVLRQPGATVTADAIRASLLARVEANRLSKYAVPESERILFVDEIPKTSVGKLDKKRLRSTGA